MPHAADQVNIAHLLSREAGEREQALQYAQALQRLVPGDASVGQLIRALELGGR